MRSYREERGIVRRAVALSLGVAAAIAALASSTRAHAAEPWVSRPLTLPSGVWAFDAGLGVAHTEPANTSLTGAGMNLEGAVGLTSRIQLGVRTGVRFGNDGKVLEADSYGRLYDQETFGTGIDTFANPEISVTGTVVRTGIVELGLQGRGYLPFEQGTRPGVLFGMPLMFHLGGFARIDTGAYVPFIFSNPVQSALDIPGNFWFQVADRVWLGPMSGVRVRRHGTDLRLGFGLGYQIASFLDFKTQFLFPTINQDGGAQTFGFGVGLEIRIE